MTPTRLPPNSDSRPSGTAPARRRFLLAAAVLAGLCAASLSPAAEPAPEATPASRYRELPKRSCQALRLAASPPRIDGKLDDACWQAGAWQTDFTQREPHEGKPGSEPTFFKVLYDDRYLYVAIRAADSKLASMPRLRGKRDEFTGDIVGINFDSYHDKRTGFEFDLTSGGSKIDLILKNDGSIDSTWDPVWDGKVGAEPGAWIAEFRIPLSQLRYSSDPSQVWGLHCWRWINRLQEESDWQLLPMDSPGLVYSFGELHGVRDLPPARRIEIMPYAVSRYETTAREPGNPYRKGSETDFEGGVDAKAGLSSNLTLDLTVNPDFGQVEADPSEVNLTTYETFFTEKRPFFLEGKSIFDTGIDDTDLAFYSRRIGHAPSLSPSTDSYSKTPLNTRILSAAKITGKTAGGLSIGVLHSVTDREEARITENGVERKETVEPMTNYLVARLQQDIDKGETIVGGFATATRRNLAPATGESLARAAYTGGFDYLHYWRNRTYVFDLKAMGSRIEGSPAAIEALMRDSVHNYQRTDATHLGVSTGSGRLEGTGGRLRAGKESNGKWRCIGSVDWRSPGFDLNDLGYLKAADVIRPAVKIEYLDTEPSGRHRKLDYTLEETGQYDFAGTPLSHEVEAECVYTLMNNSAVWISGDYFAESLDTRVLRGGPALKMPAAASLYIGGQTDASKRRQLSFNAGCCRSPDGRSRIAELAPTFYARPANNLHLKVALSLIRNVQDFQYAATAATSSGASRYVMGRMDQRTLSSTLRLDLHLTPELSLTYYGSPFVSSGRFTDFKLVTAPRAGRYADRFRRLDSAITHSADDDTCRVADSNGAFTFANPDFSVREFRSNLVLRWEYKAGSTAYFVWTQNRASSVFDDDFSASSEYRRLFRAHPDNTFLFKVSYWFSL